VFLVILSFILDLAPGSDGKIEGGVDGRFDGSREGCAFDL
jgi:hypothetical protein